MDLNALLKGRPASGLSCPGPGGKIISPKKVPVLASAGRKAPASILASVADEPESDVEEDPFAEFTVMDGLEDLDEMLTDKDGTQVHPNLSHGQEPSESLATGVAASVQPGLSDALQSEEMPGPADDATQGSSGMQEGDVHGQPCPMMSNGAATAVAICPQPEQCQFEPLHNSASGGNDSSAHTLSTEHPGRPIPEADPSSASLPVKTHTWPVPTSATEDPDMHCHTPSEQISLQVSHHAGHHDVDMTNRNQTGSHPVVLAEQGAHSFAVAVHQTQSDRPAADDSAAEIPAPKQLHGADSATTCQPQASRLSYVAHNCSQNISLDVAAHATPDTTEPLAERAYSSHDRLADQEPDTSQHEAPVSLVALRASSTIDVEMRETIFQTTPESEKSSLPASVAHARKHATGSTQITAPLDAHCVVSGGDLHSSQMNLRAPLSASHQSHASQMDTDEACATASGCGAGGQAQTGLRSTDLEGRENTDDHVTENPDRQDQENDEEMLNGDSIKHPTPMLDESSRDIPVSTATSVDSRAALLSSFWDTMSTDHAPEGADDASDTVPPGHAGQCVNSPSRDASYQKGTANPGQASIPVIGEEVPVVKISLCSEDGERSEQDTPGSYEKSSSWSLKPQLRDIHHPEIRQSLHLRTASLSPTLISSPGMKPRAPSAVSGAGHPDGLASLTTAQDEETMLNVRALAPITSGTAEMSKNCGTAVGGANQHLTTGQLLNCTAAVPASNTELGLADNTRSTDLESTPAQTLIVNAQERGADTEVFDLAPAPQSCPTPKVSEQAQSQLVRDNSMDIPENNPATCISASHNETGPQSPKVQAPCASADVRPPRQPPTAHGGSLHPLQESRKDSALSGPHLEQQSQPCVSGCMQTPETAPSIQASDHLHPKDRHSTDISLAGHTGHTCSEQIQDAEGDRSPSGRPSRDTPSMVQGKHSMNACISAGQIKRKCIPASALRPIENVMDQSQANGHVSNAIPSGRGLLLLMSDGRVRDTVEHTARKRRMVEAAMSGTPAKEPRIDMPSNCGGVADNSPHFDASLLDQDGVQQTVAPEQPLMQVDAEHTASACDSLCLEQAVSTGDVEKPDGSAAKDAAAIACPQSAPSLGETPSEPLLKATLDCGMSTGIPDYRKALAELSSSLQEATIGVDETMDQAADARVQSAVLNNRWASMLQAEMFGSPNKSLSECYQKLESVAAACRDAMAIAVSHGWMDTDSGHICSMST